MTRTFTPLAVDTLDKLRLHLWDLYDPEQVAGTDNRNDRSGSTARKIPISPAALDFRNRIEGDISRLHREVRVHLGLEEGDVPLSLLQPGIVVACPGSCEGLDTLVMSFDPGAAEPIYCSNRDCRDERSLRTRRPLAWLRAQAVKAQPEEEGRFSVLDRYKAMYADAMAGWEKADQLAERLRMRLELAGLEEPASAMVGELMPGDEIHHAGRCLRADVVVDPRTGRTLLALVPVEVQAA